MPSPLTSLAWHSARPQIRKWKDVEIGQQAFVGAVISLDGKNAAGHCSTLITLGSHQGYAGKENDNNNNAHPGGGKSCVFKIDRGPNAFIYWDTRTQEWLIHTVWAFAVTQMTSNSQNRCLSNLSRKPIHECRLLLLGTSTNLTCQEVD